MEALIREIQPEYLVWRSSTRTFPQAQSHLKPSPEEPVAELSRAQRARRNIPRVHGGQGTSRGPAPDPQPGSWPVFSIEHSEGAGVAFEHITWGCDRREAGQ